MKNTGHLICKTIVVGIVCTLLFFSLSARAQLVGTDTVPGMSCTAKGAIRTTANAGGSGAYVLTCDDDPPNGKWVATLNVDLPTADMQAANKEYVDSAIAGSIPFCADSPAGLCILEAPRSTNDDAFITENIADGVNILGVTGTLSGSGCFEIGDLCPDGTVYIGYHPTLLEPLYIPTTDQGGKVVWRTSLGPYQGDLAINSIDDGRVNSDQIPNNTTFPAFKLCKDLTFGGHSDWYLPSRAELAYLFSVKQQIVAKGNITNFIVWYYWSSTERDRTMAWAGSFLPMLLDKSSPSFGGHVRCVRR